MDRRKIFLDSFIFSLSYFVLSFLYMIGNFVDSETTNVFRIFIDQIISSPTILVFENYLDPLHSLSITSLLIVFSVTWLFFIGFVLCYNIVRLVVLKNNED